MRSASVQDLSRLSKTPHDLADAGRDGERERALEVTWQSARRGCVGISSFASVRPLFASFARFSVGRCIVDLHISRRTLHKGAM